MQKYLLIFLAQILALATVHGRPVSSIVPDLNSDDYQLRQSTRLELRQMLADAGGKERSILEVELLAYLGEETPMPSRLWIVRMLELFGSRKSVDRLAELISDPDPELRDCARRALAGIPDPHAGIALTTALATASAKEKPAFLDALAYRGDTVSVKAIAGELQFKDPQVSTAAVLALQKIGGEQARKALTQRHSSASPELRAAIERALVEMEIGAGMAGQLAASGVDDAIRVAAFHKLLKADADTAKELALKALDKPSIDGRSSILRAAMESGICGIIIDRLQSLVTEDQLLALGAISDQRLTGYEEAVLKLLSGSDGELQTACVVTLGHIGGDSSFDALYALYLENNDNEAVAESISRLQAPAADAALLKAASDTTNLDGQVAALQLLALRNTPGATGLANAFAQQGNPEQLREAAFSALESIGDMSSVKSLLSAVLEKDTLMRPAQRSLKRLSFNMGIPEYQWEVAYQPALESAPDDNARKGVLAILDGISCPPAADYLDELISSGSVLGPDAMRSLSRWSDLSSGEIWLDLLMEQNLSDADRRSAARGLERVLTSESVAGDGGDKVALAMEAVEKLSDPELRSRVLACFPASEEEQERLYEPDWQTKRALRESLPDLLEDAELGVRAQAIIDFIGEE